MKSGLIQHTSPRLMWRRPPRPSRLGAARRIVPYHSRVPLLTDRKSTRLNSSHLGISYAVFCLTHSRPCAPGHPPGPPRWTPLGWATTARPVDTGPPPRHPGRRPPPPPPPLPPC